MGLLKNKKGHAHTNKTFSLDVDTNPYSQHKIQVPTCTPTYVLAVRSKPGAAWPQPSKFPKVTEDTNTHTHTHTLFVRTEHATRITVMKVKRQSEGSSSVHNQGHERATGTHTHTHTYTHIHTHTHTHTHTHFFSQGSDHVPQRGRLEFACSSSLIAAASQRALSRRDAERGVADH